MSDSLPEKKVILGIQEMRNKTDTEMFQRYQKKSNTEFTGKMHIPLDYRSSLVPMDLIERPEQPIFIFLF
jgi:hypothetical protein